MTNADTVLLRNNLDRWLDVLNYWADHIQDLGERYDDLHPMYVKYEKTIDDMYKLKRDCEKFIKDFETKGADK